MGAVYRKELKVYMSGMFGYFIIALLLLFMGLFVTLFNLVSGYSDIVYALAGMQWVLIVLIPFLAMRSIAEERHSKTDQLLYSLPLPMRDIVFGKFFAMLTVFAIPTAISALYPVILTSFGSFSLATAYVSLLGYFLLGISMIALCTFLSSLVESQILAAVISIAALLLIYFMDVITVLIPASALVSFVILAVLELGLALLLWAGTKNANLGIAAAVVLILPTALLYILKADLFASLIPNFLHAVDLFARFGGFTYGHIDLPGALFYLSFTAFFLFVTVRVMEKRRLA